MTDRPDMPDDALADDLTIRRTAHLLRDAMPATDFSAGFADRAMARVAGTRAAVPPAVLRFSAMQRSFRVLAAAAALTIVALGVHNTYIARAENTTLVEAALGLQPVSATSILTYTSDVLQ